MFCKEYKFIAFKDIDGEKCPQVWVELYCDNDPNTLPTNGVGIDNFPKSYDPDKAIFAPGSVLIVINSGDIYMANLDGEFVAFGG